MTRTLILLLGLTLTGAASAEIYQWRDDQGRLHFGQEVPAQYRGSAVRRDATPVNVLPRPDPPRAGLSTSGAEAGAGPRAPVEEPAEEPAAPGTQEEACAAEVRRYEESQSCLKQHLNAWGRLTPEGIEKCPDVPRPPCMMQR